MGSNREKAWREKKPQKLTKQNKLKKKNHNKYRTYIIEKGVNALNFTFFPAFHKKAQLLSISQAADEQIMQIFGSTWFLNNTGEEVTISARAGILRKSLKN